MQHIALITPGILPVPASLGGAIETLLTTVIEQNEKTPQYVFDVYTVLTATQERREYRNTHIIEIPLTRFQMLIDRILDKIARTFHIPGKRVLDRVIYKQFVNCYRKRLLEESSPNQEKPYDAIIFENMTSTATFFLKQKSFPVPERIYFHMHNDIDLYRTPKDCRFLASKQVHFIANSKYIERRIREQAKEASTSVVYLGVNDTFLVKNPYQRREELRKALGFSHEHVVFLYAGRILPEKGVLSLVEAFLLLYQSHPQSRLLLVGNSDFKKEGQSEYEKMIADRIASSEAAIQVMGKISNEKMPDYYELADVTVIPSLWQEPFGMVALEACAKGCPVISTKSGGLTEALDENCALFVSNNEKTLRDELFHAMNRMLKDKQLRLNKSNAARKRMEEHPEFQTSGFFTNFCKQISQ